MLRGGYRKAPPTLPRFPLGWPASELAKARNKLALIRFRQHVPKVRPACSSATADFPTVAGAQMDRLQTRVSHQRSIAYSRKYQSRDAGFQIAGRSVRNDEEHPSVTICIVYAEADHQSRPEQHCTGSSRRGLRRILLHLCIANLTASAVPQTIPFASLAPPYLRPSAVPVASISRRAIAMSCSVSRSCFAWAMAG